MCRGLGFFFFLWELRAAPAGGGGVKFRLGRLGV